MAQHKRTKISNSYQIRYNTLVQSIRNIVWYNGLGDYVTQMIEDLKRDDFSANKFWWVGYTTDTDLVEAHFIAMVVVLLYGDYGTSPRSGWVHDEQGRKDAIAFLEELIKEY